MPYVYIPSIDIKKYYEFNINSVIQLLYNKSLPNEFETYFMRTASYAYNLILLIVATYLPPTYLQDSAFRVAKKLIYILSMSN